MEICSAPFVEKQNNIHFQKNKAFKSLKKLDNKLKETRNKILKIKIK
jgi:hypothetical protein